MKRPFAIAVSALALAAAGVLAAVVPVGSAQLPPTTSTDTATTTESGTATETTETTETTATTTTTTATTTTTPKPKPRPKPAPKVLPQGVTIGGIHVGGLAPRAAYLVVRAAFNSPLVLSVGAHKVEAPPARLGAVAYAKNAVSRARFAPPGTAVPLGVNVDGSRVRRLVASLGKRFDREPVDSKLLLRDLKPYITDGAPGKRLDARGSREAVIGALRQNRRTGIVLPFRAVPQKVTRGAFGPVIVIHRGANQLYLYRGMKPWRTFTVATGQAIYPTPLGRFDIVVKWKDPWWYPPNSPWAKGAKPIPPGPGNPLGTRWMGLSAPGVGIHGTPDPASLGYSASHGCIRMYIPYAEWLFDHVEIGTPVFIVP
ncbi:MAG: L,D-transpeptidase family protein, partial [Verrucomicrobiota bacterium]